MLDGKYEKAIEALEKETVEDKRREVAEEITYCRAYCSAQLALAGAADPNEAGIQMYAFIKKQPQQLPLFEGLRVGGRSLRGTRQIRRCPEILRHAEPGAVARLQDSGRGRPRSILPGTEQRGRRRQGL